MMNENNSISEDNKGISIGSRFFASGLVAINMWAALTNMGVSATSVCSSRLTVIEDVKNILPFDKGSMVYFPIHIFYPGDQLGATLGNAIKDSMGCYRPSEYQAQRPLTPAR